MDFSNRVRSLLKARNLSQADLADGIGTNQQQISRWLEGNSPPKWDYLLKLARFFEVTTDYLLGHEAPTPAPSLPEDEAAILRLYRNLKSRGAIDEALATHGMALATKGIFVEQHQAQPRTEVRITAETPDDRVPVPEGYDPTYRAPLRPKDPLDGIRSRQPKPDAGEAGGQAPKEAGPAPRRRKPG